MKYSELIASLLEQPIEMDGKTDYQRIANILKTEFNIKPTNSLVWKVINDLNNVEDYVELTFD